MKRRFGVPVIVLVTVGSFLTGGSWRAVAQEAPKPDPAVAAQPDPNGTVPVTPDSTTTTLAPTTTPPSTEPPTTVLEPSTTTPSTSAPESPIAPAPDSEPVTAPPPPRVHSDYVPGGSNSTANLLEALRGLENLGFTTEEAMRVGMGHFPMAGYGTYSNDWHAPRGTPEAPRLHMGTDIFAVYNTPVRAPFDGVVTHSDSGLGGKAVTLTTRDGTYYYMAHLSGFAPDVPSGSSVKQGEIVGLNGDSGNATGGSPHVHFEVHPNGGAAVNPHPILNQWMEEAIEETNALAGTLRGQTVDSGGMSSMVNAMSQVRRFDGRPLAGQSQSETAQLWATSVSPNGSALRLAEVQAARAAEAVDWEAMADQSRARATLRRNTLTPLTPAGFGDIVTRSRG